MFTYLICSFSGPKDKTLTDFWKMIWYEQINRVLMVTMLVENAKVRVKFVFLHHVWAIKTCHCILDHNSHVSWWIFTLLVPVERGLEELQNLQLYLNCVSTLPDKKLKTHRMAHFEVTFHSMSL